MIPEVMSLARREEVRLGPSVSKANGSNRSMRILLWILPSLGLLWGIQLFLSSNLGVSHSVHRDLGDSSSLVVASALTGESSLGAPRREDELDNDLTDVAFTDGNCSGDPRGETETHRGATFTNITDAFRKWDSDIGCDCFRKSIKKFHSGGYNPRSLQSPGAILCSELRLSRVTVDVKLKDWLVPSFFGKFSCRCGLTCAWTTSTVSSDDADADLFLTWSPTRIRERGQPLTAFMDLEAALEDPKDRQYLADILVTYDARATVQATYATQVLQTNLNPHVSLAKRQDVLVFWASSRCLYQRTAIAAKFLSLVPHHSFGECLNNVGGVGKEVVMYPHCHEKGASKSHWMNHINCAMSHYKFVLAIENTMTEGYATEKLFYALEAGSVPIYFGAPNVLDLVPPHSIIEGSKFGSLEELATFVKAVADNPVAYSQYHAWRRCGVQGPYNRTKAVSLDTLPCRFCAVVSKLGGKAAPVRSSSS